MKNRLKNKIRFGHYYEKNPNSLFEITARFMERPMLAKLVTVGPLYGKRWKFVGVGDVEKSG